MSHDLPTVDLHALQTVSGGAAKTSQQELELAMTQIKDSLASLKKQVTASPSTEPTQMMMMMMLMLKNR